MRKVMMVIATISAIGISSGAQAAQEPKAGDGRMKSAHEVAVKKCERLKGDARTACLKDAEAKMGAPVKADIGKPDRMQPEPMKPDVKK